MFLRYAGLDNSRNSGAEAGAAPGGISLCSLAIALKLGSD